MDGWGTRPLRWLSVLVCGVLLLCMESPHPFGGVCQPVRFCTSCDGTFSLFLHYQLCFLPCDRTVQQPYCTPLRERPRWRWMPFRSLVCKFLSLTCHFVSVNTVCPRYSFWKLFNWKAQVLWALREPQKEHVPLEPAALKTPSQKPFSIKRLCQRSLAAQVVSSADAEKHNAE